MDGYVSHPNYETFQLLYCSHLKKKKNKQKKEMTSISKCVSPSVRGMDPKTCLIMKNGESRKNPISTMPALKSTETQR